MFFMFCDCLRLTSRKLNEYDDDDNDDRWATQLLISKRKAYSGRFIGVQLMNADDGTIDVGKFDRPTVLAAMRYLYAGNTDIQQPLQHRVFRFATR